MIANSAQLAPLDQYQDFVHEALMINGLYSNFLDRPSKQQMMYIRWINSAQQSAIKVKRLDQMLSELREGNKFLSMPMD